MVVRGFGGVTDRRQMMLLMVAFEESWCIIGRKQIA
jgi:hypothetical protein